MGDVKCDGVRCDGDTHGQDCSVYRVAMIRWKESRALQRGENPDRLAQARARHAARDKEEGRKHRKKDPADLLTEEEFREAVKAGMAANPRPNSIPYLGPTVERALKILVQKGARVKAGSGEAERVIAGTALTTLVEIAVRRVKPARAGSALKAAVALREEFCEPVNHLQTIQGQMTLEQAVAQATARNKKLPPKT